MKTPYPLKDLLLTAIAIELLLFVFCWLSFKPEMGEVFRHAARYSGRISLAVFVACFYAFAVSFRSENDSLLWQNFKNLVLFFAVLHAIHFYFLATNVYLNHIQLVPIKLLGGFIGYLLVLIYPFLLRANKAPSYLHYFYFFYLSIVFIITYLARISGNFEGASPSIFHYLGIIAAILVLLSDIYMFYLSLKTKKSS